LNTNWIGKFLLVPLLAAGLLWVGNDFFDVVASVSTIVLFIFLLLQMVALIDSAYSWNSRWVSNALQDRSASRADASAGKRWYIGLFVSSAAFCTTSWIAYAFMLKTTTTSEQNSILSVNIVVTAFLLLVSISNWAKHGALLPSAVVIAYVCWISWNALLSNPDWTGKNSVSGCLRLILGLVFTALSLFYVALHSRVPPASIAIARTLEEGENDQVINDLAKMDKGSNSVQPIGSEKSIGIETPELSTIIFFNVINLSSLCYLVLLCTQWLDPPIGGEQAWWSWWVQVVAMWTVMALYLWTLVAPQLLPSRFS
jgi:hypothetical protein